jgi:lipoprotein-releasing system permease protein
MLPGRGEAFIALVAGISLVAVMLGVAALVIVMSVMNGFRAELLDKIVGLNGRRSFSLWRRLKTGSRCWRGAQALRRGRASPLIEQPLLASFNGRVEASCARPRIRRISPVMKGSLAACGPGGQVAWRAAGRTGAGGGHDRISRRALHPFGTVPPDRYRSARFEIGVYDMTGFVVMPMQDARRCC